MPVILPSTKIRSHALGLCFSLKAEYLLGLRSPTTGSIFNETSGMLSWIAAGRYGGYLPVSSMPHPNETDPTGEEAYTALVATVSMTRPRKRYLLLMLR